MSSCKNCGKKDFDQDDESGLSICVSCGAARAFDNYQHPTFDSCGFTGTNVRSGTVGSGTVYNYKENKINNAQKLISDILSRLGLESRYSYVNAMIAEITESEYGLGNWFPILVGACVYVDMRNNGKSFAMSTIAGCIDCDVHELGRMVGRVVDYCDLKLKLPEFDIVGIFDRAVKNWAGSKGVGKDKEERMLKQGIFLIQCLIRWSMTTGRRPVPVVVAVFVFVVKLNQVDVRIEDVARELNVAFNTCRLRYNELLEKLVEVARAKLPWGKDVTVKNIMRNAPFVIQYMEAKSMCKRGKERKGLDEIGHDLEDFVAECLEKENEYRFDDYGSHGRETNDSKYFESIRLPAQCNEDLEKLKLSHELLSTIYLKYLDEFSSMKSTMEKMGDNTKRRGLDSLVCAECWTGKSELSKKLLYDEIWQKDVGLDALPPSFVAACMAYQKRREKIKAAKVRIEKIRCPSFANDSGGERDDLCPSECVKPSRKRRKLQVDIDWEDFVIETLLLHQVKEEEIEKGYYKTLMDLHVFKSGGI